MSTPIAPQIAQKYCPIIKPTKLIGDIWTILIVKSLLKGQKRFNQIREEIPEVTSRTLSQRLKFLCEMQVITRTQFAEIPPRVEYELTDLGMCLKPVIEAVEEFGNSYLC
jgi:DNA-binding HxlR family transcriptional regulator